MGYDGSVVVLLVCMALLYRTGLGAVVEAVRMRAAHTRVAHTRVVHTVVVHMKVVRMTAARNRRHLLLPLHTGAGAAAVVHSLLATVAVRNCLATVAVRNLE